jgi:hypothetical protein
MRWMKEFKRGFNAVVTKIIRSNLQKIAYFERTICIAMSQGAKFIIKFIFIAAIFVPYKFLIVKDQPTSFLQDFLVALVAFGLAQGLIYLIENRKA